MKTRKGFISNSSSSSFVLSKKGLNVLQLFMLRNHSTVAEMFVKGLSENDYRYHLDYQCPWTIEETENEISGHTSMDNFDMRWFLESIGVDMDKAEWTRRG